MVRKLLPLLAALLFLGLVVLVGYFGVWKASEKLAASTAISTPALGATLVSISTPPGETPSPVPTPEPALPTPTYTPPPSLNVPTSTPTLPPPTLTALLPTLTTTSSPVPATPIPTPTTTPSPTPAASIPAPATWTSTPTPAETPPALTELLPAVLVEPADNASFTGRESNIVLKWEWDGTLQGDEYYFVEAKFTGVDENGVCRPDWSYFKWTKETNLGVDPWLYDVVCPSERSFRWTVQVARPTDGLEKSDGISLTPDARLRRFTWALGSAGNDVRSKSSQGGGNGGGGGIYPPKN
jgi:hypothetical protein